jgi:hypothetical protein
LEPTYAQHESVTHQLFRPRKTLKPESSLLKNQFPDFQSLAGFGFCSGDCSPAAIDFPLKFTH